jgi:hypothetical protein
MYPMADQAGSQASLSIPADTQAKFGEIIQLITGSESMNAEERQYWINILPIMTPEQITNLKEILVNEKEQLAAIDAKYTKEITNMGTAEQVAVTDAERKKKRQERQKAEMEHKENEEGSAEDILKQIEGATS